MEIPLFLYNSFSRTKEAFKPLDMNNVRMYVCGPTVYDRAHIGNARPVLVFDILFRLLRYLYGKDKVTYVRNITDIDDKINAKALERGVNIEVVTEETIDWFHKDMDFLGALRPNYEPRATAYVSQMIEMVTKLISLSFAYPSEDGHVFFEVEKFADYGQLSNKKLGELKEGVRIENETSKRNPLDFVLWKPSSNEEPGWDSPWGKGRPGWHLECSAMSKKFLGNEFDIHGGGIDLIFPHHENEIAQSRCANENETFANYWVHNGFITMSNEKMAKSQGNILKISELRNKLNGQVLRLALISAHYKQALDWNDKLIKESQNTINKWYECYVELKKKVLIPEEILSPLYDDLNTPGYIANLHSLFDKAQKGDLKNKQTFVAACNFIGLLNESKNKWDSYKKDKAEISEKEILAKIKERNEARDNKNYKQADKIRDELLLKGISIEDKDGKTTWKFK